MSNSLDNNGGFMLFWKFVVHLLLFLTIASCGLDNNKESQALVSKKEVIKFKQLIPILESNNYNYIKQVFENYKIENINEVYDGFSILDRYQGRLDERIVNILIKNGAKTCWNLENNKCEKLSLEEEVKYMVNNDRKYKNSYFNISYTNNINDILREVIYYKNIKLLKFILDNIKEDINKIKININVLDEFKAKYKKSIKISILDYVLIHKEQKIINLIKKYGAKKRDNILNFEYEVLDSYEILVKHNRLMNKIEAIDNAEKMASFLSFNLNSKDNKLQRLEFLVSAKDVETTIKCYAKNKSKRWQKKCVKDSIKDNKKYKNKKEKAWIIYYQSKLNKNDFFIVLGAKTSEIWDSEGGHWPTSEENFGRWVEELNRRIK
jgi:hypothetical protein